MSVGGATNTTPTRSTGVGPSANNAGQTHTVKKGDTLSGIAKDNNVSLQDVIKANPQIKNPDLIFPGQEINIPSSTAGTQGTQQSQGNQATNGTQNTSGVQGQSDSFDRNNTSQPQVSVSPQGSNGTAGPQGDPGLANEVNNLRAGGGYRTPSSTDQPSNGTSTTPEQGPPQGSLHTKASDGQTGSRNVIGGSNSRSRNTTFQQTRYPNHTVNSRTDSVNDGQSTTTTRNGTARNNTTGRELNRTSSETTANEGRSLSDNVGVGGSLGGVHIAGDNDYHGLVTSNDTRHTADETGAGGEYHALAAQGSVDGAATVDFKAGNVNVGINATGQADLVGASGRAQLGSTSSVAGGGFVEGEAHIGARADVGAGVRFNPAQGEVGARVGAEGFVGAEVRGSVGYENRYGGASVTGRGQAGLGGAASAELSYSGGKLRARADLGAAVGLGGRVTVDLNVNVGNIVSDVGSGIADTWNSIWD